MQMQHRKVPNNRPKRSVFQSYNLRIEQLLTVPFYRRRSPSHSILHPPPPIPPIRSSLSPPSNPSVSPGINLFHPRPHGKNLSDSSILLNRRAPQPPQVQDSTSSIVNVDSQHLKDSASSAADSASNASAQAKDKASAESGTAKEKASDLADSAEKNFNEGKGKAKEGAKDAEKEIKGEYNEIYENRDNPVVIGNAVAITLGVAGLGYGAYTQHAKGELNWQIAGIAAAAVGLFGVGDYYLSQ